jgi:hypothetical protein
MNEQPQTGISPEYIDGEVMKVIGANPGITKASVYYLLNYLPQTLVYSSIKRLEVREAIGYSYHVRIIAYDKRGECKDD